jgi:transcriptional repressor NrdR
VRFASVYRSFQDLEEFRAEIDRLSSSKAESDTPS